MKIFFTLVFPLLLLSIHSKAQGTPTKIYGVLNVNKQAVPDASIALFNSIDSNLADGALSAEDGSFSIDQVAEGSYYLRVSAIGFTEKFISNILISGKEKTKNLGNIALQKSELALRQVEIVKERSMLEMSIDKKVFNVDKNITATGGTASDVLQNIPSITVDASGNVSLRGKGNVNILIDGRPATLLAGDVASALQSMPAGSIQSVEVITNPSSKYDAQGSSGIINIITKVNKNPGINGSANLGIGTRNKYNGGINLNLRKNKWNFSLNSNFRINRRYQITETSRQNLDNDSSSFTYADYHRKFDGLFNSLTIAYDFDTNNKVSLTQNLNVMRFGSEGVQTFNLYSAPLSSGLYNVQERAEVFKGGPNSSSSNLNWKHKFKQPKQELTTDLTYSFAQSDNKQTLNSNEMDGDHNMISTDILQQIPSTGSNKNVNAQLDYTTPLGHKEGKLDLGLKTQNFWFKTNNNPTTTIPGSPPVEASFLRNEYQYYQQTHAAYSSYANKYKKWSYQGGLRLEYAGYNGTSYAPATVDYSNSFLNLFPSAYIAYSVNDAQQLYINYSKRIDRPFFLRMLPYLNIANALDTSSGNPNLKPEFINNVEFSYNLQLPKGNNILVSLYYQRTSNLVQNFTKTYADGTSFSQPVNLSSGSTYGLELTDKTQITKAWDATISANFFQNKFDGDNIDPSVSNNGFSWFGKLNSNYKLSKQISFQLMANYESAKPEAQGRRNEVYWVDAAIKASFLKNNKASIVLNVSDIFNTRKYTTNYQLPLYDQSIYRNRETRIGTITFSYMFGKSEFGPEGRGKRSGRRSNGEQKKSIKERDDNIKSGDEENNG